MKLGRREMGIALMGGIVILALLYYFVVVSPALSKQESLAVFIEKKEADLVEMDKLRETWLRFKKQQNEFHEVVRARGDKFTLLSFLERITREEGINKNIQYMKPVSFSDEIGTARIEGIEMRLDNLSTKQLAAFLHKIEYSGKLLNIKRIKILRTSRRGVGSLRLTVQVITHKI
ncbi:hypothetical protein ACFL2O_08835 [Thermodesulfobacteriota bacterium]